MADLTVSANVDSLMGSADFAAFRTLLSLTALSTTTPGTGVATALAIATGSAGGVVLIGGSAGTPASINLSNGTLLPLTGLNGLASGMATFLATPTSANLSSTVTDETGFSSGAVLVFSKSPTIDAPTLTGITTVGTVNSTALNATTLNVNGGASPTVSVFGDLSSDNNLWGTGRGAPIFFDGTAATALVNVLVSDTPTNGQVPTWNTGGTITWETPATGLVAEVTLTDGATITQTMVATQADQNAKVTLGGNRTLAFTSLAAGMRGNLRVIQDGTGTRTLALPSNSRVNGSVTTVTLLTAAAAENILSWYSPDGTAIRWTNGTY